MTLNTLPDGLKGRQYGSYRLYRGGSAQGAVNLDQAVPKTFLVTASGDTEIIPAPGAAENLVVKGFHFSNDHSSKVTVSLKAGTGDTSKFSTVLAANGGNLDKNLVGRYWYLPINQSLIVNLSGTSSVYVTVEYEGGEEPGEEAKYLTDAITFAESISAGLVEETEAKALADSLVITEAKVAALVPETETKTLADSLVIADSSVQGLVAETETKTLSDSQSIAEEVGNLLTLSLSDASDSFTDTITRIEAVTPP